MWLYRVDIIHKIIRDIRERQECEFRKKYRHYLPKKAKEVAQGARGPFVIDEGKQREFLGPRRFLDEVMERQDEVE